MIEYAPTDRIIRKPELCGMIGLSDVTIWRMERENRFPSRIRLGANSVGWRLSDVMGWINSRAEGGVSKPGAMAATR